MGRSLSVVNDDVPEESRPASSLGAAVSLDERELLVAMRAKVAAEIDAGVPPHALAPLMRQLRELDKEIRGLDAREDQKGPASGPVADDEAFDASSL